MAAPGKRQISADVSEVSVPSENPVTFVDEEGKVAPALLTAMKKETCEILLEVEKSYRLNLDPRHSLTRDVQRRIDSLREQDHNTLWGRLRRWFQRFTSLLTRDTEHDENDSNPDGQNNV